MQSYLVILTLIGLAALGMAWMPAIARKFRVSYAIFYVFLGMLLYITVGHLLPLPDPISKNKDTLHITEVIVLVSLMGTGLKIDQPFSFRQWAVPFRLVSITMILSIAGVTVAAYYGLGFDFPTALLLGAVLAPTDPVLASDVQVGPPLETSRDNIKFSLTAEAGMNDGTAFPFTWLAIALAAAHPGDAVWGHWLWYDLGYRIVVGIGSGFLLGRLISYLLFRLPEKTEGLKTRDGFVAISATLLVYGITEMLHGYGFMAVFATAVTMRNFERFHKYHTRLHEFTDQIERLLIAVVLILFGGSLVMGILKPLTWPMVILGGAFVLLWRPLTALAGMIGTRLHIKEKLAIGFFGIRGMGSFFYLAFALQETFFARNQELWALVAFVVVLSILVHGLTAPTVIKKLEPEFAEEIEEQKVPKSEFPA